MLEAMAAGDAVVATRAGAAEMIITDGDDGMLAPIDDVEALIAALEPLMREPERIEAMGRRARARVVNAFSRDREADEISNVYRQVWAAKARERGPPLPSGVRNNARLSTGYGERGWG
jgi:mannosyltransferase